MVNSGLEKGGGLVHSLSAIATVAAIPTADNTHATGSGTKSPRASARARQFIIPSGPTLGAPTANRARSWPHATMPLIPTRARQPAASAIPAVNQPESILQRLASTSAG